MAKNVISTLQIFTYNHMQFLPRNHIYKCGVRCDIDIETHKVWHFVQMCDYDVKICNVCIANMSFINQRINSFEKKKFKQSSFGVLHGLYSVWLKMIQTKPSLELTKSILILIKCLDLLKF